MLDVEFDKNIYLNNQDYKISFYDKDKNLIAGEELEYFYAPQVWKGAKLNFAYGSVPSTVVNENEYLDKSIFDSFLSILFVSTNNLPDISKT